MMPNFQDPPPYASSQGATATKPIIVTLRHHRLTVGPAGEKRWGPLLKTYHDAVSITSTTTRPELMKMLRQRAVRWSNVQRLEEAKNRYDGLTMTLGRQIVHPAHDETWLVCRQFLLTRDEAAVWYDFGVTDASNTQPTSKTQPVSSTQPDPDTKTVSSEENPVLGNGNPVSNETPTTSTQRPTPHQQTSVPTSTTPPIMCPQITLNITQDGRKRQPAKVRRSPEPNSSTASKSISVRLIQQIPGKEDAIIRQVDENVIIPCSASRDDVTKLLESRVNFHFDLNTSAAHKEATWMLSMAMDGERQTIADEEQWQASKGRMADGATLQYDLAMRAEPLATNVVAGGSSIASISVVATLTQRSPGKISADGERMEMNMSPSAVVRQVHDAILITSNATRSQVFLLLFVRIKAHFRINLSPDHRAPQGYASMVMAYRDRRISLVDESGWEAARGWLDTGTVLEVDFAVPETKKEAEKMVSASKGAVITEKPVEGKNGKGHHPVKYNTYSLSHFEAGLPTRTKSLTMEAEPFPPPYEYTQAPSMMMPVVVRVNHRKSVATSVETIALIHMSTRSSIISSQHDAIIISQATTRSELFDKLLASIDRVYPKEVWSDDDGKYFCYIASVVVNDARIELLDDDAWEAGRAFLLLDRATLQVDFAVPPTIFAGEAHEVGLAAEEMDNVMRVKHSDQKKRSQQEMCVVQ
ncbi:hypothetical protein LTR17_002527 [Elasticomyces elasticus]|nr:hypothetical protein LTR17_002527 [Elasticomyces elasticus]